MRFLPSARFCVLTCALTCTLAMFAEAQAQVSIDGRVTGFHYTLADLAPNDGIAPVIRFYDPSNAEVEVSLADGSLSTGLYKAIQGTGPLALSRDAAHVRSSSVYDPGDAATAPSLGISLALLQPGLDFANASAQANGLLQSFSLAPHTRITWSMDTTLDLSMGAETGYYRQTGQAYASLFLWADPQNFWGAPRSELLQASVGQLGGLPYRLQDSEARTMSVSYENTSDDWLFGMVAYRVDGNAAAWNAAPPVPEPQGWAMLGLGMGVLGLAKKKRRPRACEGGAG